VSFGEEKRLAQRLHEMSPKGTRTANKYRRKEGTGGPQTTQKKSEVKEGGRTFN